MFHILRPNNRRRSGPPKRLLGEVHNFVWNTERKHGRKAQKSYDLFPTQTKISPKSKTQHLRPSHNNSRIDWNGEIWRSSVPLPLVLARIVHALIVVPVESIARVSAGPGLLLFLFRRATRTNSARHETHVCAEGGKRGTLLSNLKTNYTISGV